MKMDKKEAMNILICHKHNIDAWVTSLRRTRCPEKRLFCDVQISEALDTAIEELHNAEVLKWKTPSEKIPMDCRPVLVEAEYRGHDHPVYTVGFVVTEHGKTKWELDYDCKAKRKRVLRWKFIN